MHRTMPILAWLMGCSPTRPAEPPRPAAPHAEVAISSPTGEPGPAYVLIGDIGLVKLDDSGVALIVPSKQTSRFGQLVVDDEGTLWASGVDGAALLRVRGSQVERIELDRRGRHSAGRLAPAPDGRLWIATNEIEWTIGVVDGNRFHRERTRADFAVPDGYSDNKLEGLVAASSGVFVVTWNGLFRRAPDGAWSFVAPPEDADRPRPHTVLCANGELVAIYGRQASRYDDDGWHELALPSSIDAFNRRGDFVGTDLEDHETLVTISALRSPEHQTHGKVAGFVFDVTVDESGRVWLATKAGLVVLGRDGAPLETWNVGELPHLDRAPNRVAVVGSGPRMLPSPRKAPGRVVNGRIRFFRSSKPVAAVRIVACDASFAHERCKGAPNVYTAETTTSGNFTLHNVVFGELALVVQELPAQDDCSGPFVPEPFVFDATDCPGDGPCDLGTLEHCLPFELPPPPG